MSFPITGNPILDFAVIQAMSIFYLSESALQLVKWQNSENHYIRKLIDPPAAAWYNKAVSTGLKTPNEQAARPCMKTTAYSIQTLSQLSNILPEYQVLSYLSQNSLHRGWKAIASLQLEYCLEYQSENSCTPGEHSAILEGGSYFLLTGGNEKHPDFMPALNELFHKITEELDMGMISTMELAYIIRGVSIWFRHSNTKQRNDFLASIALEILNRKSRSGLFYSSPEGFSSAPSGQQFFILDALLKSYPFIQLDHVIEEVFSLFSSLYRIAYKDAIELFSFKRRNISYTAFEVGALISCLNSLAFYSTNEFGQRDIINNTIDSFLDLLFHSYNQLHEKEIKKLIRWICLSHEGNAKRKNKPNIRTVFPKRIHLSYPNQEIDWTRKGVVSQSGIFYLCSSLLSLISKEDTDIQKNLEVKMDIPAMEAIKALLDIFITQ